MLKCEVIEKACITVEKGSTVLVSEAQFELARVKLKPIKEEKKSEKKTKDVK